MGEVQEIQKCNGLLVGRGESRVRFPVTPWFVPGTDMGDGAIDTSLKS